MKLDIHGEAIQGARHYQEDCFEICVEEVSDPEGCLVVLCDGMGGHKGGAVASSVAATAFINHFLTLSGLPPTEALQLSLDAAHQAIRNEIAEQGAPPEMGTTLVAVYVVGNDVHWVSAGDSHLYYYRKGRLEKLNQDHSMAAVLDELVEIGRISPEEARMDPQRNALRSCLSADDISLMDLQSREGLLRPSDKLFLASDGLDTLEGHEIEKLVTKYKRKTSSLLVSKLLKTVEQVNKPNQDNTTIVIISAKGNSWF